ncbi:MAG: hypothetical protein LBD09_04570 [Treponema sp.]|jgi:hypothetical protein|nr:hypothetical protein [Treponema sp.]
MKRLCKAARLCLACALCLGLSGCFNVFHYVTRLDNGADRHILKLTFRNQTENVEQWTETEEMEEMVQYMREFFLDPHSLEKYGARISQAANDVESNYLVSMDLQYNKKTMDSILAENPAFIPRYTRTGITVPLPAMARRLNDDGASFLAPGFYRLVISKRCMAELRRAELTRRDGAVPAMPEDMLPDSLGLLGLPDLPDPMGLTVVDLGDQYLVEVPLVYLFADYRYLKLYSD